MGGPTGATNGLSPLMGEKLPFRPEVCALIAKATNSRKGVDAVLRLD